MPLILGETVTGVMGVFIKEKKPVINDPRFKQILSHSGTNLALSIQGSAALADQLYISDARMSRTYETSILGWIQILQLRNLELARHSRCVALTSAKLAQKLGLNDESLGQVFRAAMLHDLGKIALPDEILRANNPLSEDEEQAYRQHVMTAEEILSPVASLKEELTILVSHHERWDGLGYPHHLAKTEIPLGGRMIAVADSWDFLRSPVHGHVSYPMAYAINHMIAESGSAFDPDIVKAFLSLLPL
jgi:HD-GYP domain-containing protein (c-di-GMP phosphodiesterase class II)